MTSEKLNDLLLEGLASGEGLPIDARFWSDLREEAMAQLRARKRAREEMISRGTLERVPLKVRELIRLMESNGWRHIRTNGSHRIFRHPDGRTTVISGKSGKDLRPGTYSAVLRQTGVEEPKQ